MTRKQMVFLISFPIIHLIVSIVFLLVSMTGGMMPEEPPPFFQEILAKIGGIGLLILWAPLLLWKYWGGPVSHAAVGEYAAIMLCGIFYAFVLLFMYKKVYGR